MDVAAQDAPIAQHGVERVAFGEEVLEGARPGVERAAGRPVGALKTCTAVRPHTAIIDPAVAPRHLHACMVVRQPEERTRRGDRELAGRFQREEIDAGLVAEAYVRTQVHLRKVRDAGKCR